jgi:LysR family transcriptional regulator, regulator for bpeEF and oprC
MPPQADDAQPRPDCGGRSLLSALRADPARARGRGRRDRPVLAGCAARAAARRRAVLGRFVLAPSIPRFLDDYPELSLSLTFRDHLIDPIAEGVDVVLRMAELRESDLVQKKLGVVRFLVVASPAYLARHGRPASPADLRKHATLGFLASAQPLAWCFRGHSRELTFSPTGRLHSNSAYALCRAALAGQGIVNLLELNVRDGVERGELEVLLGDYEQTPLSIHALYTREAARLPKVRVFLDFVAQCLQPRGGLPPAAPRRGPVVAFDNQQSTKPSRQQVKPSSTKA